MTLSITIMALNRNSKKYITWYDFNVILSVVMLTILMLSVVAPS
jgi:hypothetical protein